MAPDQRTFVRAALKQLGLTPTQLGNRLGKDNGYSAVNSWITEKPKNYRRLSFDDAMAIADLCGWLSMAEDRPTNGHAAGQPEDPLAALAASVAALERGQAKILNLLEAQRGELRELPPTPAKATAQ